MNSAISQDAKGAMEGVGSLGFVFPALLQDSFFLHVTLGYRYNAGSCYRNEGENTMKSITKLSPVLAAIGVLALAACTPEEAAEAPAEETMEAPAEETMEAPAEAGAEAGMEAGMEAGAEAGAEAGMEAGAEAGAEAAPVAE